MGEGPEAMGIRKCHEAQCPLFKALEATREKVWKCKRGYTTQEECVASNKNKHEKQCTGDKLKNRMGPKFGRVEEERFEFVHWRHLRIAQERGGDGATAAVRQNGTDNKDNSTNNLNKSEAGGGVHRTTRAQVARNGA